MEEISKLPLPEAFLHFLKENGLDPSVYTAADSNPRYIRLKAGSESDLEEIEADIKCKLEKVVWLSGFYSLPPDVKIANSMAYKQGKIYGIDAASGAAVSALNISMGDHVLDLCAAPGKSVLPEKEDTFREWTSRRPWKERKRAAKARENAASEVIARSEHPELIFYGHHSGVVGLSNNELYQCVCDGEVPSSGYDKVIVDAECTHDGSIKHIQKFENWGWTTLQRRVLDAERTDSVTRLQLKLLTNGFRLLKVGGLLVYSTCSLTVAQNEDVVERFLKEIASAELQEIEAAGDWPCKSGRIPKTLRFAPSISKTSGLFIAKFKKLAV